MHKPRNMLLVVLVLGAAMVFSPRLSSATGTLQSDPSVTVIKPGANPVTGEPDVGQTLPHASSYNSVSIQAQGGHEWSGFGRSGAWLMVSRIWAALYLKIGI